MTKFKVGDMVKRIDPSDFPESFGTLDQVYKVLDVHGIRGIKVIDGMLYARSASFELVDSRAENIYFRSEDVNECRNWMRDNSMEIYGAQGWMNDSHDPTKIGAIIFKKGIWEAVIIERF